MSFGITDQQRENLEKEEYIHNHPTYKNVTGGIKHKPKAELTRAEPNSSPYVFTELKYPDALNGYTRNGSKLIDVPELYLSSEDYDRIYKNVVGDILEAANQDKMSIKEYDKDEIDKFLSTEFSKDSEKIMDVMAVPNPNAYIFRGKQGEEAIEEAKYITIGTEDGWLECKNNKAHKEYLQAKAITEEYEFVKAIKLEAYREFAKELNEKIDFYRRNYDLDYGMLIDFFEDDINEIVRYKEEE